MRAAVAIAAVLFPITGCMLPKKPLLLPVETVRSQVRTVCMEEFESVEVTDAKTRVPAFRSELEAELKRAGFDVVEDKKVTAIHDREFRGVGRIFDRDFGTQDDAAYAKAREAFYRAAHDELGCDAMASARIVVVVAALIGGDAKWDGARLPVPGAGDGGGRVAALSLQLTLRAPDQKVLYFNTGGIQPLVGFEQKTFFGDPEPVDLDQSSILGVASNNSRAIRLALEPFLPEQSAGDRTRSREFEEDPY